MADQYYLKALDAFPYDLADTVKNLTYAISYDDEHCPAHCLMGQVYMYHMKQYEKAEYHFNKSLSFDLDYPETFKHFILLKIWISEFSEATKMINFAFSIKGMSKALLFNYKAIILECSGSLHESEQSLIKAQNYCLDDEHIEVLEKQLIRVKSKAKRIRKASKKGVATFVATP